MHSATLEVEINIPQTFSIEKPEDQHEYGDLYDCPMMYQLESYSQGSLNVSYSPQERSLVEFRVTGLDVGQHQLKFVAINQGLVDQEKSIELVINVTPCQWRNAHIYGEDDVLINLGENIPINQLTQISIPI